MYLSLLVAGLLLQLTAHAQKLSDCKYKLEPIGCFADRLGKRTLPEQIINERDRNSNVHNGYRINWNQYDTYLPQFLCRCATAAYEKGYDVVGIQFFGECWSGPNAARDFNKYGIAKTCVNEQLKENYDDPTQCQMATGMHSTNYVYRIAPTECKTYYEPVGCFNDKQNKPRPVPNYISTDRDYSLSIFSGKLIDWNNWNTYSPEMICRCATLARSKGHKVFAIQYWGECWSGSESAEYDRDGVSTNCRGKDFKTCPCNSYHCVGKAYTNYVYKLTEGPTQQEKIENDRNQRIEIKEYLDEVLNSWVSPQ